MLIVTYDMNFAKNVATRVLHLEHGVVYRDGKPKEILADPGDVL